MLKKFVPLDADVGPSQTPYDIKTFKAPAYDEIPRPVNIDPCCYAPPVPCKIGKVRSERPMTTEEAIFRLFEIPPPLRIKQSVKKKCKNYDSFKLCVMEKKTPSELKHHANVREKFLLLKGDLAQRVHDANEPSSDEASVVRVQSQVVAGQQVKPRLASPACSLDTFYVPSRKLLDLKRPRSGIFINETPRPTDSEIPFETYNPRKLTEKIEAERRSKYRLYSDGDHFYFPWMKGQGDIEPRMPNTDDFREDCVNFKPVIFPIPNDLHRTFRAAVVFGNGAMEPYIGNPEANRPTEIACLYVAYVQSFLTNPDYWSASTMDTILENGIKLCDKSMLAKYQNPDSDFDIIPEISEKEARVAIKIHLTGALTDEPNILKALTLFFDKYSAAILCSTGLYFLIWKRCANSFYIFDPNGRDVNCKRDFVAGKSSLMAVQTVEHIVHLTLNYSKVKQKDEFHLYEISILNLGRIIKPTEYQLRKPAKKMYAVVNRFYAVIPGLKGITQEFTKKITDDNGSMMTSFLALVYSQIDPPRGWRMQVIDDLVKFGCKYSNDYIVDNKLKFLNAVDLPEMLLFGNYHVLVEKKPFVTASHVVDCWSFRVSQLTLAIREFFNDHKTGLLQIDYSTLALWTSSNMYFVFDPFKRGPAGQVKAPRKISAACLQIHLNLDSLCRMIFMIAVEIKSSGNFFLHGIRVRAIGTFKMNRSMQGAKYGTLRIRYPFDCDKMSADPDEVVEEVDCPPSPAKTDVLSYSLVQCLSELSISPCERTCSERDFLIQQRTAEIRQKLKRTYSIKSIPEQYLIPEFDNVDVIDAVVGEFICDLLDKIAKKVRRKPKVCVQASKIFLQSDKGHLEDLKKRLKRGEDYDNICAAFKATPYPYTELSLEQELNLETNYTALPDGSWAIFGNTVLDATFDPLRGILSTICAAALSTKFVVSTWSSDVVEYALEASGVLEERFWSYNHTLDLIFKKRIPKIQLGSIVYHIKVLVSETVVPEKLKDALDAALLRTNKLFLICKGMSCLIIRRFNFIYMFMGAPCDVVGFRTKANGSMCMLRFLELNAIIRRIESGCGKCGKYVIVLLHVKSVTPTDKFGPRSPSQEALVYGRELTAKEREKQRYRDKMRFIQYEIRKEAQRAKLFQKEKKMQMRRKKGKLSITIPPYTEISDEGAERAEEDLLSDSESSVEFKHKPGRSLDRPGEEEEVIEEKIAIPQMGYQLRDQDCLFKIQGTIGLEDRQKSSTTEIKPCFFASTIALLYALLRPLNHWNSGRIDKIIAMGRTIAKSTTNFYTAKERIIKNIDVDEFTFKVKVQVFIPMGTFGGNLEYKLSKTIQTQRYFLIQISNTTFAIYYDKFFHLFDPYNSMVLAAQAGNPQQPTCPENIITQPEQNTASWVLFSDMASMLEYIGQRAVNTEWKNEFKLHTVSIISYKTAPRRIQLLNLLTDEFDTCPKAPERENLCAHPEEIEWLDIYPNLVIWSRLNRCNAVQRPRGSHMTKEGNYDVEIPDKLFSLWGSIHPISAVFGESRGKQHLAIDVVSCCVASVYQVNDWNAQILDSIVIKGDSYYRDSIISIKRKDYEISMEHLNTYFQMGHLRFTVHLESVVYGYLYETTRKELNLSAALTYFFMNFRYGVIQCMKHSVAIGKTDSGFFMFECQSHGLPLFNNGQGAAYVLRTTQLQILLYCIIMTLNIQYYNAQFTIHKVEIVSEKSLEAKGEAETGEEEEW